MMKKVVNPVSMLVLVSVMLVGLVGCGQKEVVETPPVDTPPVVEEPEVIEEVEVSMVEVVNTIKYALGEQYLPSMPLDQETFNQLTGLTSDMYEEFYAEVPMMSAHVDKLFVVKAADEIAAHDLSVKFEEYHRIQVEDAHQYPMNLAKVENAKVSVHGDYVFYYILGGYPVEEVEEVIEDVVVDELVEGEVPETDTSIEVPTESNPNSAIEAPVDAEAEVVDAEAEVLAAPVEEGVEEISEVDPEYEKLAAWAIATNEKVEAVLTTLFEVGYDDSITAEVEAMFGPTMIFSGEIEEVIVDETEVVDSEEAVVEGTIETEVVDETVEVVDEVTTKEVVEEVVGETETPAEFE